MYSMMEHKPSLNSCCDFFLSLILKVAFLSPFFPLIVADYGFDKNNIEKENGSEGDQKNTKLTHICMHVYATMQICILAL